MHEAPTTDNEARGADCSHLQLEQLRLCSGAWGALQQWVCVADVLRRNGAPNILRYKGRVRHTSRQQRVMQGFSFAERVPCTAASGPDPSAGARAGRA